MASTSEAERAAIYRSEAEARAAYHLAAEMAMAGSEAAAEDLRRRWAPLMPWEGWEVETLVKGDPK